MWYYRFTKTADIDWLPIFLVSIGLHELQPRVSRPNGYAHHQFFFHDVGEGVLMVNGTEYNIPEKGAMFIPADVPHEYYPKGDKWNIRWVTVNGSAVASFLNAAGLTHAAVFSLEDISGLDAILGRMRNELVHNGMAGEYQASAIAYDFIINFARTAGLLFDSRAMRPQPEDVYAQHMAQLSDYIEYHFVHHVYMEEMCSLLSVTPQHICRVFKYCTGMRPMEYIQRRRVEESKKLLRTTDCAVEQIAQMCGFDSSSYFCRVFKRLEDKTPSEYRRDIV